MVAPDRLGIATREAIQGLGARETPKARPDFHPTNVRPAVADFPNHLRRRAEWLDRLSRDPEVSATAFRVAYVVGSHLNRETGLAWPSVPTIAGAACVSVSTAKAALAALIAGGHLLVEHDRGRGRSNRYAIPGGSVAPENSPPADCFTEGKTVEIDHEKRSKFRKKTAGQSAPNISTNMGAPKVLPNEHRTRRDARAPDGAALGDLTKPTAYPHDDIEIALSAGELSPAEAAFLRRARSTAHA